jgi:hypothetical protein
MNAPIFRSADATFDTSGEATRFSEYADDDMIDSDEIEGAVPSIHSAIVAGMHKSSSKFHDTRRGPPRSLATARMEC